MRGLVRICVAAVLACAAPGAMALDALDFEVAGSDEDLERDLKAKSLLRDARSEGRTAPRDLFAAALAEYTRLLETLYAAGHYGGTISVRIDGREAAAIPLLSPPTRIGRILVQVDPGPAYRFGTARMAPLAPGTDLPSGFARGKTARSTVVLSAVENGIDGWRAVGRAKARVAGQDVTANHATDRINAEITLAPGPEVTLGPLEITGKTRVRHAAIRRITGYPVGEVYSPEALARVADRLRRTGAFASVVITEGETLAPGDMLPVTLAVSDSKPRRIGAGAEISSLDGAALSAYWLHRNFFGGAERFRVDAEVTNINAAADELDFAIGARLEQPGSFGPDTTAFTTLRISHEDARGYISDEVSFAIGASQRFSDQLQAEIALKFSRLETQDTRGERKFSVLSLPGSVTWDMREEPLDPTGGYFAKLEAEPFLSVGGDEDMGGLRSLLDTRAYRQLGRVVLAGRAQVGALVGARVGEVPPDYLFYSGGGGTVRGQPYQSLGLRDGSGDLTGGRSFLGLSAEVRTQVRGNIGAVAFYDTGYIGPEDFPDASSGDWHAGAGIGLRYKTVLGPLRVDLAVPIVDRPLEGSDVQLYIGIGQAF